MIKIKTNICAKTRQPQYVREISVLSLRAEQQGNIVHTMQVPGIR